CQDLTAIDPALAVFDRQTTAVEQFESLARAVRSRGGRLILDVVINHTGWGATLQENHPEWYARSSEGGFVSPGAWGVVWEDLSELEHKHGELWEHLAGVFLTWCARGVDGFRCDAGYKVPVAAWQHIIARVRQEFPNTVFLLEGLGGAWSITEELLAEGGMQWAYSELFQNYTGADVARYLDYALRQSVRLGAYAHYSETHDNLRLAASGKEWSAYRNQLCALTSVCGAYGITAGVEWLAPEKINVHQCGGLNWGAKDNIVSLVRDLTRLLSDHPCFFDGAVLHRLSPEDSPVYALARTSASGEDKVIVVINTDVNHPHKLSIPSSLLENLGSLGFDLLGGVAPEWSRKADGQASTQVPPGACLCLSGEPKPVGLAGEAYRATRARAAFVLQSVAAVHPKALLGEFDWRALAEKFDADPAGVLAATVRLESASLADSVTASLRKALGRVSYPEVVEWRISDTRRTTMLPPNHWLMLIDSHPFRALLRAMDGSVIRRVESVPTSAGYVAAFFPKGSGEADMSLELERQNGSRELIKAVVRRLSDTPAPASPRKPDPRTIALLTNGRGGMARMAAGLGWVQSKYDCVLAGNLHPEVPTDRHVFAKRIRMWLVADGFIGSLDHSSLVSFSAGPTAKWNFEVNAGDGRKVGVELEADMLEGRNTTVFRIGRVALANDVRHPFPANAQVSVTIRVDLEDRNFHSETQRNGGTENHFDAHCSVLADRTGFRFDPAADRVLQAYVTSGSYHPQSEWSCGIEHPIEQSRGQTGAGDAYSPGWFSVPVKEGASVHLVISADPVLPSAAVVEQFARDRQHRQESLLHRSGISKGDKLGRALLNSAQAFVVRRGDYKTVVAGYPWFLDWGRDTLICARGLLAGGLVEEVKQLLQVFGRFESHGTLPNTLHGENASNRETSDAPLWYGVVCEELVGTLGNQIYQTPVEQGGRTLAAVLRSIAAHYRDGTPNGIRMDAESGLIWSPTHFTWMDTNYPAGTPREGYPVEIQALWIRLLKQVAKLEDPSASREWMQLAAKAEQSFMSLFWQEDMGTLADVLIAARGVSAREARPDRVVRSNAVMAIGLGILKGKRAQRLVETVLHQLAVPGGLRSLAPLPADPPLEIRGGQGQLLNDPHHPYWGQYAGDEDTRRKPAYHNGTAWTWTFPGLCEALTMAWDWQPQALAAARAYLGSVASLMRSGCEGHLPEVMDGDHPHTQRGCDAQAWGASEALRVWRELSRNAHVSDADPASLRK
ncbi:MAG: amylo-alpha-1,6-glucosidase, partial [Verrucomicrobia bacterium]|nr:amylo-alpha-1,6-glucosidase [Verrucomicrobiota bacterium]